MVSGAIASDCKVMPSPFIDIYFKTNSEEYLQILKDMFSSHE